MREFRLSDLEAVLRIEVASFPEGPYPEWLFREWHRRSPKLFLVATGEDDAHRHGWVAGYVIGAIERGRGRIISLAVDPSRRRRGVARQLCDEVLRRLESAGVALVDLETRLDNRAAIRLWKRLGFQETGVIRGYYGGGADALTMSKVV